MKLARNTLEVSKDTLEDLYFGKNMTQCQIAEQIGISEKQVRRLFKSSHIKARTNSESKRGRPRNSRIKVDSTKLVQICQLYQDQKLGMVTIAQKLGLSTATVSKHLHQLNLVRPKSEAQKIRPNPPRIDLPRDLLEKLYLEERKSSGEIATFLKVSPRTVFLNMERYNIDRRGASEARRISFEQGRWKGKRGRENPQWKGGKYLSGGYVYVLDPSNTGPKSKYIAEHILVWEQTHNRKVPKDWVVHHLNGIKSDNRPDNLVAYPRGKHAQVIPKLAEKIRRLEIENQQLKETLEVNQSIFYLN